MVLCCAHGIAYGRLHTGSRGEYLAGVVTYGVTNEPGDIDVSPSVYESLNQDEWPRGMTWQFTDCPVNQNLVYEFQTEANQWWTSLWVRNPKVPIESVEVVSENHSSYYAMERGSDGTFTDASGFGAGAFTLRITGMDGRQIEESFSGFEPGALIEGTVQF